MLDEKQIHAAQQRAIQMLDHAGIALTSEEKGRVEVCDYNLGDLPTVGTEIIIYVNTSRCCAKEIVLFPRQICPEHYHPALGNYPGKEETFRCRWGEVYLYVSGESESEPKANVPPERIDSFTVWHEVVLRPGEQYTLEPETLHWFQAGPDGAIVSEFSTPSFDSSDVFTDPQIRRLSNLDS
mgnify:CR=1 FL=1